MNSVIRSGMLIAAVVLAGASASQNQSDSKGSYYGQQVGTYDEHGNPVGGSPATPAPAGEYYCHDESSERFTASQCRPTSEACEAEREAAAAEGLTTTACVPTRPAACFQLGNVNDAASTWCAATIEDCELWRRIDYDKNGITGHPCQWR